MGLPLPRSPPAVVRLRRRRGGSPARPLVFGSVSFYAEGFALRGESLCPRRQRDQNAAGGVPRSPHGSSGATPGPPFTGVIPIFFRKSSGAQNTVPGFYFFRATGPWCGAKFRPVTFYRRAWFRPAVAEGAGSEMRRSELPRKQETGGPVSHPYGMKRRSSCNGMTGGASPSPAGWVGKHSAAKDCGPFSCQSAKRRPIRASVRRSAHSAEII